MTDQNKDITSIVAKEEDGTLQITYTIASNLIKKTEDSVLDELAKEITVPGFRKGMAPKAKVKEKVSKEMLIEKVLNKILPSALAMTINKDNIKPAVYPKFELISAKEDEDWQVRALTCELPIIDLSDYKNKIIGEIKAANIWTPDKKEDKEKNSSQPGQSEKQQKVVEILLKTVDLKLPKLLVDAEVDSQLSSLLEKIEKLGLTLESYLTSINKDAAGLRKEYESRARESLTLELILNQIADIEKVKVSDKEIDELEKALVGQEPEPKKDEPDSKMRYAIKRFILRKKTLDYLTSLI